MLTQNRRNYAAVMELQEGHKIPKGMKTQLQMAGLTMNKTSVSDDVKARLQQILYEDVMLADTPDQIQIMKQLAITEKQIVNSIMKKETGYYKPDNIASLASYDEPLRVSGIVAAMVYNEMATEGMPKINLEERNKIIKIKIKVDKNIAGRIKDKYPVEYEKLMRLLDHPTLGARVNTIALPVDVEVPDWVLEFVDINTITSDALKNFPLESLGLKRLDNPTASYTNIISL